MKTRMDVEALLRLLARIVANVISAVIPILRIRLI